MQQYDVIIFGTGITGATLGLVLARQGVRTLLLDRQPHPRFALGESLLKPTVLWMRVMASRFDAAPLATLANLNRIHTDIAPTSGVKKSFGFVRHEAGAHQVVAQWWANIAMSYAEDVLEGHLFRQDIDAWLHAQAIAAGCDSRVGEVGLRTRDADGVCFDTPEGPVQAAYVVDTTGRSPLFSGPQTTQAVAPVLRTNSRSIYTHLRGVRPFDACAAAPQPALPWHQGTLHHLLDGAWIWVIPFDNHPRSTNGLVSVGVNFDNTRHPDTGQPPAAEWAALLARYPALQAQFGEARAVRPWVATGRLQHAAADVLGERCCLLGQAVASVDALFSRGMLNAYQGVHLLAELLLEAVRERDYATARFAPFARLNGELLRVHDLLVHGSYLGFRDVELTHWWLALWSHVERLSLSHVAPTLAALERGDDAGYAVALADLKQGHAIAGAELALPVLETASDIMRRFEAGTLDVAATRRALDDAGEALRPLGFDPGQFEELSTRYGFSDTARRLLRTEHALTAALEIVDRHAGLPIKLRSSAFVHALVRLVALRAARAKSAVLIEAPELAPALCSTLQRLTIPGLDDALMARLADCVARIDFSRQANPAALGRAMLPAGWGVLVDCHVDGRHVSLRARRERADGDGAPRAILELLTEADDERLVLRIAGTPPDPALLAALGR